MEQRESSSASYSSSASREMPHILWHPESPLLILSMVSPFHTPSPRHPIYLRCFSIITHLRPDLKNCLFSFPFPCQQTWKRSSSFHCSQNTPPISVSILVKCKIMKLLNQHFRRAKRTICFVMPVCLSIRAEKTGLPLDGYS